MPLIEPGWCRLAIPAAPAPTWRADALAEEDEAKEQENPEEEEQWEEEEGVEPSMPTVVIDDDRGVRR